MSTKFIVPYNKWNVFLLVSLVTLSRNKDLSRFSTTLVNSLFTDFISFSFLHTILVFTNDFVFSKSTSFFYFILKLNISFSDKLHIFTSLFTAEFYAIISTLQFILSISTNDILIAPDSPSCLLVISSNQSFQFHLQLYILRRSSVTTSFDHMSSQGYKWILLMMTYGWN